MADLQGRVRERVRADLVRHGASSALEDPALFAEIDEMLRVAIIGASPQRSFCRSCSAIRPRGGSRPSSNTRRIAHLSGADHVRQAPPVMPVLAGSTSSTATTSSGSAESTSLFACVQELAIETTRLRCELRERSGERLDRT